MERIDAREEDSLDREKWEKLALKGLVKSKVNTL